MTTQNRQKCWTLKKTKKKCLNLHLSEVAQPARVRLYVYNGKVRKRKSRNSSTRCQEFACCRVVDIKMFLLLKTRLMLKNRLIRTLFKTNYNYLTINYWLVVFNKICTCWDVFLACSVVCSQLICTVRVWIGTTNVSYNVNKLNRLFPLICTCSSKAHVWIVQLFSNDVSVYLDNILVT